MSYATIELDLDYPLATTRSSRLKRLNAISQQMMGEITAALAPIAEQDDAVRCVIFRGAGRCFSAGFEIADEDVWVEGPRAGGDRRRHALLHALGALDLRLPRSPPSPPSTRTASRVRAR